MHDLLETLKNSVDFLFIQEAPIHFIRRVPSSTSELGDELIGPVIHRDWQCVDKRSIHPDSQVAIYVNKRLSASFQIFPDFSPAIDPNILVVCVRHNTQRSNFFNLVNIYNRPGTRHSAIHSLLTLLPALTNVAVIEGDFNLRSPLWDPGVTTNSGLAEQLFTTFSNYGLNLTNDDSDPTWTNGRGSISKTLLDFVPPPAYFGHANFSHLNAPSSWWCTPWALSGAPRRLFCATPFSDAFDGRRQTRSRHRPARSSAFTPCISQQVDCTPPSSWRHRSCQCHPPRCCEAGRAHSSKRRRPL